MRRGRLADQLKIMSKGNVLYVEAQDKDITGLANYYNVKGLTTERCVCFHTKSKKVVEIVMVKKKYAL